MLKLTITFVFIGSVLVLLYGFVGVPQVYEERIYFEAKPHRGGDASRSIRNVHLYAVYFTPNNKVPALAGQWQDKLHSSLDELVEFHNLQLQGLSHLKYSLYPQSVMGERDSVSYDTESTDNGNPRALINIAEELQSRLFDPSGDLYIKDYVEISADAYPVLLILYEGVGASGGIIHDSDLSDRADIARSIGLPKEVIFPVDIEAVDGFILVNREFLNGEYTDLSSSIIAHEFYHTLGVADLYGESEMRPTGSGIMGRGRFQPLAYTYLDDNAIIALTE